MSEQVTDLCCLNNLYERAISPLSFTIQCNFLVLYIICVCSVFNAVGTLIVYPNGCIS